jgi:hypothetical protein
MSSLTPNYRHLTNYFSIEILGVLGTTRKIIAPNAKIFANEIGKYVDSNSQNQQQTQYDDEDDIMDIDEILDSLTSDDEDMDESTGQGERSRESHNDNFPSSLWPLIREVHISCPSAALSTGAVLVDLPGVADTNAARNNVAKEYMKKVDVLVFLV